MLHMLCLPWKFSVLLQASCTSRIHLFLIPAARGKYVVAAATPCSFATSSWGHHLLQCRHRLVISLMRSNLSASSCSSSRDQYLSRKRREQEGRLRGRRSWNPRIWAQNRFSNSENSLTTWISTRTQLHLHPENSCSEVIRRSSAPPATLARSEPAMQEKHRHSSSWCITGILILPTAASPAQ
jgi:hypothetical protein